MIEFGDTLRRAREAKGLTATQLAQTTHLLVQQIDALEREDFSKIAAGIYGRGFVKLYCEAVGLDPQPMVAEFMELYSGNRPPVIRTRPPKSEPPPIMPPPAMPETPFAPASAEPAPVAAEPPAPVAEEPPAPVAEEPAPVAEEPPAAGDFFLESEVVPAPKRRRAPIAPEPQPEPEPAPVDEDRTEDLPFDDDPQARPGSRGPSVYRTPVPIDDEGKRFSFDFLAAPYRWFMRLPTSTRRICALVAAGLVLLWLLVAGFRAAYRATIGAPGQTDDAIAEQSAQGAAAKPNLKTIPVYYLD